MNHLTAKDFAFRWKFPPRAGGKGRANKVCVTQEGFSNVDSEFGSLEATPGMLC